jgi:hypothetical protein
VSQVGGEFMQSNHHASGEYSSVMDVFEMGSGGWMDGSWGVGLGADPT